jgi:hypothetical protein
MNEKTILVVGGFALAGVLIFALSKQSSANAQASATKAALLNQAQYSQSTAGQVNGILAGVGSFFNSGALNSLSDMFSSSGTSNDPGLVDSTDASLNDPGLYD